MLHIFRYCSYSRVSFLTWSLVYLRDCEVGSISIVNVTGYKFNDTPVWTHVLPQAEPTLSKMIHPDVPCVDYLGLAM
jgi:hypothetical protein